MLQEHRSNLTRTLAGCHGIDARMMQESWPDVARILIGCTFVTDTLIRRSSFNNDLAYYRIAALSPELTTREVFIAHKKNRYYTRAMRNFIELAHSIFSH